MNVLIGNTGLVGQALADSIHFDLLFNSKTIESISSYDLTGSTLYLSCLPATKWKVNQDPVADLINATSILEAISCYSYSRIVLISTIDVYCDSPLGVTEDFIPTVKSLNYGSNRYFFELSVKKLSANSIEIFRLPALFGPRLKKNVLFDLLTGNNLSQINYNSAFQWYNLSRLATDITEYGGKSITANLFSEPIETAKLLSLFNISKDRVNLDMPKAQYNWKTLLSNTGYIQDAASVFSEITSFVNAYQY